LNPLQRIRLALAILATAMLPAMAQAVPSSPLTQRIAAGKWDLAYQRDGIFKPLRYKYNESGNSSTCIKGDPRQHILDWVGSKGCRVDRERLLADRYQFSGECRLKWMKKHPVPVDVDLIFGDARSFRMDIRTRDDALISFHEVTRATYAGRCPAP
jgi:hypothetical protein